MSIQTDEVQGNVLQGYGTWFDRARHFACGIGYAAGGRSLVASLLDRQLDGDFKANSGEHWGDSKPDDRLNVGFTWRGLQALGVPEAVLLAFPPAFREGPAERARTSVIDEHHVGLGDVRESDPERWDLGGPNNPEIHIVVSAYAHGDDRLEELSGTLRQAFARYGVIEHSHHDATALDNGRVHFGFRDGLSQPQVAGAPRNGRRLDPQPDMPTGDLLLGCDYVNSFGGNHAGDLPHELVDNATYGAFRILYQDVAGFNRQVRAWSEQTGIAPDLLRAKLMGRWPNGTPLSLSPDADRELPNEELNAFDYVALDEHPDVKADPDGLLCPVGAHVRRLNPRGARVMGLPHSRRIVRRSMPYGPELEGEVDDNKDRGLVGYFFCGDLETQFEFLQRVYANDDIAASGIRDTRDPVGGTQPVGGGRFRLPTEDKPEGLVLDGLESLVHTRGGVYCLLPGLGGLRYLRGLVP